MKWLKGMKAAYIAVCVALVVLIGTQASEQAQAQDKPNILVIFGDDIGMWNISAST